MFVHSYTFQYSLGHIHMPAEAPDAPKTPERVADLTR